MSSRGRHVVLSGFMATGKSTLGPLVAARLGRQFVDTDATIENETGRSVPELWKTEGEAKFRAREAELVERLVREGDAKVLALGGGAVTQPRTRRLVVDQGLVVTLRASPEAIVARIGDVRGRPNLAVGGDPEARARDLLALRAEAYAECHLSLWTDRLAVDDAVTQIVELVARDPLLVPLGARSYAIDVCIHEPAKLAAAVARCAPSSLLLVTDDNVAAARGAAIDLALQPLGLPTCRISLAPGEPNKTLAAVSRIWDAGLGARVDRDCLVVAAGGGVVGDLAGFAAACLLRGVRFVQVPTTLLAMVDSSVGGKTGCDHEAGKNLIGAFHQPSAVVADLAHLTTLSAREQAAGLAEVVKIALATDAELLAALEANCARLAQGDSVALLPIIRGAIEAKVRIVRDDERESGPRALLNLGHTIGHALEAHGGYGKWLHGEAVALGTVAEMRATAALGLTPAPLVDRAARLLSSLGLPTEADPSELRAAWPYVSSDKKRGAGAIRLPVVVEAGVARVERIDLEALRAVAVR
jgi:shikimate kinase/3-dehydroquinate synthase